MSTEKYPTTQELQRIKDWDYKDSMGLVDFLGTIWWSKDWGTKVGWGKDGLLKDVLVLELHTGGWSGNEEIMTTLQMTHFHFLFWYSSRRGGHYEYHIDPFQLGYKKVRDMVRERAISRQAIHQGNKFDWLTISPKKQLIRLKP